MKEGPARAHLADLIRDHISRMASEAKKHPKLQPGTERVSHWEELQ